MSADFGEQLTFSGLEPKSKRKSSRNSTAGAPKIVAELPVASVMVEKLPIHLDQLFDYLVPEKFDSVAVPGALVKVPFGAQQLDGYIVSRLSSSEHKGRLAPIKSVVSKVSLLPESSLELFRGVAEYYGGSASDIARLAVPPRHATTEKAFIERFVQPGAVDPIDREEPAQDIEDSGSGDSALPAPLVDLTPLLESWFQYTAGRAFVERLTEAVNDPNVSMPRGVWTPFPGYGLTGDTHDVYSAVPHWAISLAVLAEQVRRTGKRALIVVPTTKDVNRLREALGALGLVEGAHEQDPSSPGGFVTLTHELSPAQRYGNFLLAKFGKTDIVVGTRAAAFAPIPDLALTVCWDDGDSSHQDQHSPYPHSREVLALRSELASHALLVGSVGRTLHAQSLLGSGFAGEIAPPRESLRVRAPHVVEFGEYEIAADSGGKNGRLPERVWREITKALAGGPVLIQVPRGGYVPTVACSRCREAARCVSCHGPLGIEGSASAPQCRWCGALSGTWSCDSCGNTRLRAIQIGSERTAEELRRAFPGVPVISSAARARDGVVEQVSSRPSLVIATPGAEPHVSGGYVLAVLLDAHVGSGGSGLYAHQQALARWQNAATLVQPRSAGGKVYLVGSGATLPTAALVRWDAVGMAARELDERIELHLPPTWRVASISGDRSSVAHFLSALSLPHEAETLGPVEVQNPDPHVFEEMPYVRAIVRVPMRYGRDLAKGLNAMARIASAKRQTQRVDVALDPKELL